MSTKELNEMRRLSRKWACRRATMREMERCMELNRQHEAELRRARPAKGEG